MSDEKNEPIKFNVTSKPVAAGGANTYPFNDITLKYGNLDVTAVTQAAILLVQLSDGTTLYYSAQMQDRGYRADWHAILYAQVNDVNIDHWDLGTLHAFCGTSPQQINFGVKPEYFDIVTGFEIVYTIVSPPARC